MLSLVKPAWTFVWLAAIVFSMELCPNCSNPSNLQGILFHCPAERVCNRGDSHGTCPGVKLQKWRICTYCRWTKLLSGPYKCRYDHDIKQCSRPASVRRRLTESLYPSFPPPPTPTMPIANDHNKE
ncbi:hypothetical protein VP01_388g1 [Puccinia sorghi]|uniref:Uncharacterized protein n=1 Tax=Puccinia sorghi TaxID=27349 RepID=A0A0L6USS3_9BASI|nr:hypothetical protein VP01_388g1 [Puccinia sorghi]